MRWKVFFKELRFLPIWPLVVSIFLGWILSPFRNFYDWELARYIAYCGWLLISLRYIRAMKYGAPLFDWLLWLGCALGISVLAMAFVATVAGFVD